MNLRTSLRGGRLSGARDAAQLERCGPVGRGWQADLTPTEPRPSVLSERSQCARGRASRRSASRPRRRDAQRSAKVVRAVAQCCTVSGHGSAMDLRWGGPSLGRRGVGYSTAPFPLSRPRSGWGCRGRPASDAPACFVAGQMAGRPRANARRASDQRLGASLPVADARLATQQEQRSAARRRRPNASRPAPRGELKDRLSPVRACGPSASR